MNKLILYFYLCFGKTKIGCASEIKMNKLILYFTRLALSLLPQNRYYAAWNI